MSEWEGVLRSLKKNVERRSERFAKGCIAVFRCGGIERRDIDSVDCIYTYNAYKFCNGRLCMDNLLCSGMSAGLCHDAGSASVQGRLAVSDRSPYGIHRRVMSRAPYRSGVRSRSRDGAPLAEYRLHAMHDGAPCPSAFGKRAVYPLEQSVD